MAEDKVPLVLDVDGTLLASDLLFECFWAGLARAPGATLAALRHLARPARLKAALVAPAGLRLDLVPVNPAVMELARAALAEGREVILASASDRRLVAELARLHGFSERVFASEDGHNLKAEAKAAALVAAFGVGGFDYAGDSRADRAVWAQARRAYVVGDLRAADIPVPPGGEVIALPAKAAPRGLWTAIRPHQWVKNVLLFLPLIAAHRFDIAALASVIWGMVAFSAAASAIYLVNDLLDLEADRRHPKKCTRPFAAGTARLDHGMAATAGLVGLALAVGATLGANFLWVVVLYMGTSLAYSLRLKRARWVDVATLAALYTERVVAGAAAAGIAVSIYTLIFVFPVFIALGCVKRLTELTLATSDARLPGRGYGRADRGDLLNVAGLGVAGALVIFFLYTISAQGRHLYPDTWLMWVAMVPMGWWMIRMVALGWFGKQDYDPIVFALRDRLGLALLMVSLSLMFWAAGLWAEWFGG
ncbi:UbiA family prenyltransferase [Phaeovulum vinaykumarii]|uniref:4-hydroxybenzoate polyprenyltransferase n=1 Tax=Phaeovulum vinaykumarii TaxID=407234 RepID=A0A1N7K0T3_9RHOB|nr:UbiA family prenyltransferase [Phaeovulum vinaykumarii]SIS55199.1 4-hydroxybenzoate polyprenyltransferase [Phaeovulum vinaykumarii]SOB92271.1 4-hydroxybenzoate polyprenyltransferase [Phaeovulum vinaykumarii]